jgi:hypothetical protein
MLHGLITPKCWPTCRQAYVCWQAHDSAAENLKVLQLAQALEELCWQHRESEIQSGWTSLLRGRVLCPEAEVRQCCQPEKDVRKAARL